MVVVEEGRVAEGRVGINVQRENRKISTSMERGA